VVPQEYGIEPVHKVSVGLQIAWKMLAKLLQDMLAGMDAERHMEVQIYLLYSQLTRVAAPSPRASLGRRTVCGRTEQLSAGGFEALRN